MSRVDSVWDRACKQKLYRTDAFGHEHLLDRGINYFILKLEALGCKTYFSCEGHPNGFYIVLTADYPTALAIARCGFFSVSITGSSHAKLLWTTMGDVMGDDQLHIAHALSGGAQNWWRIAMDSNNIKSERSKREALRWATESWEEKLDHYLKMGKHLDLMTQALTIVDELPCSMSARVL